MLLRGPCGWCWTKKADIQELLENRKRRLLQVGWPIVQANSEKKETGKSVLSQTRRAWRWGHRALRYLPVVLIIVLLVSCVPTGWGFPKLHDLVTSMLLHSLQLGLSYHLKQYSIWREFPGLLLRLVREQLKWLRKLFFIWKTFVQVGTVSLPSPEHAGGTLSLKVFQPMCHEC